MFQNAKKKLDTEETASQKFVVELEKLLTDLFGNILKTSKEKKYVQPLLTKK